MGNVAAPSSKIARAIQLITFAAVLIALGAVSWRKTSLELPDVGQFAGIAGSAFLGGVLNPIKAVLDPVKDAGAARNAAVTLQTKFDALWLGAVAIGGAAIISGAAALAINGEKHVNAAAALTAMATAFGGLFFDTSRVTHVPDPSTIGLGTGTGSPIVAEPEPAPAPEAAPEAAPATTDVYIGGLDLTAGSGAGVPAARGNAEAG